MAWQDARRLQRQHSGDAETGTGTLRFSDYFDPVADPIALVVHAVMGGGAAALFGMTGQIDGVYATFAVGASAPVLLTQMAQLRFVSEAVAGAPQPTSGAVTNAEAGPADTPPMPPAAHASPQASEARSGAVRADANRTDGEITEPENLPRRGEPRRVDGQSAPPSGAQPRRARIAPPDSVSGQEELA
ncbi:hypothetical protein [Streptomyces sp. NRRL F-5755]|uniref:hypothetical protein n=1 Tax=Streptomyces sp. NRRL F-5755 TaxID=1519475 RepID=UPI0018FE6FAD|nr:hypothetical protein [Streptomyces sp. NRRL F-5755]